ncbi:MAG: winged helix-turn-helix transcriptional regulator [Burkholderiaceae bacterium]|nr:winged helix-turn-helix transcriptional regulator [Burkholderiaceae bacterium]MEB2350955.1 winged helix-turn-helix transcriptional regulator [Burkholderiaceae bacterium]
MRNRTQQVTDLDRIDRHILRLLQAQGRMSMTELADRVGLSVTPCSERVKRLERDGFILGYHARLDPHRLGQHLLVFVEIKLAAKSGAIFDDFRREVLELPNVLECHLVSGEFDYLIKARIPEMGAYRKLLGDMLLALPGARESRSYMVMEEIKESLVLDLPEAQARA